MFPKGGMQGLLKQAKDMQNKMEAILLKTQELAS